MDREIIKFVREYPALWDKTHNDYRKITKYKIWSHLALKLGMCEENLKKRWKTLRDRHYRVLKMKMIPSRNGRINNTNYKYGQLLHFLNRCISPNDLNLQNNMNDNEQIVDGEKVTWETDDQNGDFQYMKIETDSTIDSLNGQPLVNGDNSLPCSSQTYLPAEEKIKIEDIKSTSLSVKYTKDLEIQDKMLDTSNVWKESTQIRDNKSPVMLFMMSLAAQIEMANLSPKSFLNLQIKLLQAVNDEID